MTHRERRRHRLEVAAVAVAALAVGATGGGFCGLVAAEKPPTKVVWMAPLPPAPHVTVLRP